MSRTALFFQARTAKFGTDLTALGVRAASFTPREAEWTWLPFVTSGTASMIARVVSTITLLLTFSMVGLGDFALFASLALIAGVLAKMSASQEFTASSEAAERLVLDVDVTIDGNLVMASRDLSLHRLLAFDYGPILVLVAWQRGFLMTAIECYFDVLDKNVAVGIACIAAGLRTKMLASLLKPGASFHAVDGLMKHVGVAFCNTCMSTIQLLLAKEVASCFR